jgi:hypothetical protein
VVYDEIKFTADQMQTLTHEVSYMFARATKGVCLPTYSYFSRRLTSILGVPCQPSLLRRHCVRTWSLLPSLFDARYHKQWHDHCLIPQ